MINLRIVLFDEESRIVLEAPFCVSDGGTTVQFVGDVSGGLSTYGLAKPTMVKTICVHALNRDLPAPGFWNRVKRAWDVLLGRRLP